MLVTNIQPNIHFWFKCYENLEKRSVRVLSISRSYEGPPHWQGNIGLFSSLEDRREVFHIGVLEFLLLVGNNPRNPPPACF
jgi:hypothetical protein